MARTYRMSLVLIAAYSLLGCASSTINVTTRMESVLSNPSQTKYRKILLFVPIKDLIIRNEIERSLISAFSCASDTTKKQTKGYYNGITVQGAETTTTIIKTIWTGVDSDSSLTTILFGCTALVPLWDELNPETLDSILSLHNFDATLVITPEDYWIRETYIPQLFLESKTNVSGKIIGNSMELKSKTTPISVGGYTVEWENWKFDSRLYDFNEKKLIWKATSLTTEPSNLLAIESFTQILSKRLQEDEVIPKRIITTTVKKSK